MLSTIRDKTQGWIAGTILGLLTLPFAFWGISSYFEASGEVLLAEVAGDKILAAQYQRVLDGKRRELQGQLGRAYDPKLAESPEFKRRLLDSLVDDTLLTRFVERAGYRLPDAALARLIREGSQFQKDGVFEPALYETALRESGFTVAGFERRLREERAAEMLANSLAMSRMISSSEISRLARLYAQQRAVEYVLLPPERFAEDAAGAPKNVNGGVNGDVNGAVERYYRDHPDAFRTPERVRIQYVRLSASDMTRSLVVTEDDLRKAYDDDARRYTVAEQRRASHLLINVDATQGPAGEAAVRDRILKLRSDISQGKAQAFQDVARKHSQDPGSAADGGSLGWVPRGVMVKEFETALYGMKVGELSQPIRSQFGYHLILLHEIRAESRKPFVSVRAEIGKQLRERLTEERFFEASERLSSMVYEQSDSLKPAADALGLSLEETDWFSRENAAGLTAHPRVIEAAFDAALRTEGRNSNAIEVEPGVSVVIRVQGFEAAAQRPLDTVRADIVSRLARVAQIGKARSEGLRIQAEIKSGGTFTEVIRRAGLGPSKSVVVTRDSQDLPAPLLQEVFRARLPVGSAQGTSGGGTVAGGADLVEQGYAVFMLTKVEAPVTKAGETPPNEKLVRKWLEQRLGPAIFRAYLNDLRKSADVKLYPDRL